MPNTHLQPDVGAEVQAICGDLLPAAVLSTTWPSVSAPASMTLAAFATQAYVRHGSPTRLMYVNQEAQAVTLAGSDGSYWLAIHHNVHEAVAGWTRQRGGHYLWQSAGTQPADPPGGLVFTKCTVAGGVITAVDTTVGAAPRGRVAYGGSTGTLAYAPLLVWDDTTHRLGVNLSGPAYTIHASGTVAVLGQVLTQNTTGDNLVGFQSQVTAAGGSNRWSLYTGDAPSHLGGTLSVAGTSTLTGAVSFGNAPQTRLNLGLGNMVTLNSPLPLANGGTAATDAAGARANLGLGNLATINSPLPIANGGTQASDAGTARSNLGLGSMAVQNSNAVSISGGGATLANGAITLLSVNGGVQGGYQLTVTGQSYFSSTVQVQGALNTAGAATLSGAVGIGAVNPGGYTAYIQGNCRIVSDLLVNTQAYKPGNGPWSDSSHRHMKTDIVPITGALALLLAQQGYEYTWTEPLHAAVRPGRQYGFIQEEITIPQWIDPVGPDGNGALAISGFEALCIESLKEIIQRLEALESLAHA